MNHLLNLKFLLILSFTVIFINANSQSTFVKGTVSGIGMQDVKILKKLKKNIAFEGTLKDVSVSIKSKWKSQRVVTKMNGAFQFEIPSGSSYTITFSKKGYTTLSYIIKTKKDNFNLTCLNPLLEKGNNSILFVGTFLTSRIKKFIFKPNNNELSNSIKVNQDLAIKSCKISNSIKNNTTSEVNIIDKEETIDTLSTNNNENELINLNNELTKLISEETFENLDSNRLSTLIDSAKAMLLTLDKNSTEYSTLVLQIELAEMKLKDAQQIIELKNKELDQHQKVILFVSLFLIAILLILLLLFYFFKQINNKNKEITANTEKITSSIEYASLIQKAILPNLKTLSNHFTDSFIYYKPKDIVSGDFYWFKEVDNKIIIVASDCTGHGVPGALLTMLGISALDRIVTLEKETQPNKILIQLDIEISEKLKDENPFQLNGMDISIICFDKKTKELSYCGAMREIALISKNGEITNYKPNNASIASGRLKTTIENQIIEYNSGDTVVMYSDGYQDQFKGGIEKIETYNYKNFQSLLSKIGQLESMNKANEFLNKDFNEWKGQTPQIDDVMIMGLRIK